MNSINLLILSTEDIQAVIDHHEIIEITRDAYRRAGLGQIVCPTKVSLTLPGNDAENMHWINSMPALLSDENIVGIKWVNVTSLNRTRSLPVTIGTIILNDAKTAVPLAIMDGTWITHMRTGASVAIGAKYLARSNSEVVTIIGAGSEGCSALEAIAKCFKLRRVNVVDINKKTAENFVENEGKKIKCDYHIYDNPDKAAKDADIIILTTTSRKPILKFSTAKPGDFICTISCMTDLDIDYIKKSNKFVVDDINCTPHRISAMSGIEVTPQSIYGDICEIIAGKKCGRKDDREIITWVPSGMGAVDIAVASQAYKKAVAAGIGVQVPLIRDTRSLLE
jgi:alanine dehydrogenase